MSALPTGIVDINHEEGTILLSSEYAKHGKEICQFAAERAKEEKDMGRFAYYQGRIGVFEALLQILNYNK